jgi:hypothetical protein
MPFHFPMTDSNDKLELAAIELKATKNYLHSIEVNYCHAPLRAEILELMRSARASINAAVRELQHDINDRTDALIQGLSS